MRSTSSSATGRLTHARSSPRSSLERSNGCRLPSRLTTHSADCSRRSKVVKRAWQSRHSRRRRMASPASLTRDSSTRVSPTPQAGQIIRPPLDPALCVPQARQIQWQRASDGAADGSTRLKPAGRSANGAARAHAGERGAEAGEQEQRRTAAERHDRQRHLVDVRRAEAFEQARDRAAHADGDRGRPRRSSDALRAAALRWRRGAARRASRRGASPAISWRARRADSCRGRRAGRPAPAGSTPACAG